MENLKVLEAVVDDMANLDRLHERVSKAQKEIVDRFADTAKSLLPQIPEGATPEELLLLAMACTCRAVEMIERAHQMTRGSGGSGYENSPLARAIDQAGHSMNFFYELQRVIETRRQRGG